jgi:murein L,D-transpeptidase YcbB/YkuD
VAAKTPRRVTIVPSSMKASRLIITALGAALSISSALAEETGFTSSITSLTRSAPSGKLATQTEIIAERSEPAMVTASSLNAIDSAIAMYEDISQRGGWPTISKRLQKGDSTDEVVLLRQRLTFEGYLPTESLTIDKPQKFDGDVKEAVKAFQSNHGLAQSGKVDDRTLAELNVPASTRLETLRVNRPRIQAYLEGLGPRYILVNIPSAQLEAVNFGSVYSRHNIVVGKLDNPSPTVISKVSEINFNPYWNVPASIGAREIIPKLIRDPNTLAAMHMRVFDGHDGPELDPSTIDWTAEPSERFFFRQDPGEQNALGTVKINFPNPFNVYLHDTPAKALFGQNARYESHGCIRVDKVQVLIDWILSGQDGFDPAMIENVASSGERYDMPVRNPPDVRIMYLTAWATDDGRIHFRPDVYNLDHSGFVLGQPEPQSAMN